MMIGVVRLIMVMNMLMGMIMIRVIWAGGVCFILVEYFAALLFIYCHRT